MTGFRRFLFVATILVVGLFFSSTRAEPQPQFVNPFFDLQQGEIMVATLEPLRDGEELYLLAFRGRIGFGAHIYFFQKALSASEHGEASLRRLDINDAYNFLDSYLRDFSIVRPSKEDYQALVQSLRSGDKNKLKDFNPEDLLKFPQVANFAERLETTFKFGRGLSPADIGALSLGMILPQIIAEVYSFSALESFGVLGASFFASALTLDFVTQYRKLWLKRSLSLRSINDPQAGARFVKAAVLAGLVGAVISCPSALQSLGSRRVPMRGVTLWDLPSQLANERPETQTNYNSGSQQNQPYKSHSSPPQRVSVDQQKY